VRRDAALKTLFGTDCEQGGRRGQQRVGARDLPRGLVTLLAPAERAALHNRVGLANRVAVYALLLAWNDYLYQAMLLASRNSTVSVTQGQLFADVDAPWNAMMAAAIIYVLPPIALLFALRRYVVAGLAMGDVEG
jgi:hypothetical protein